MSRLLVKEAVGEPFLLQNLIVPVALVDPPTLTAVVSPMVMDATASAGELTAPLAAVVLADTGALAVGEWNVYITIGAAGANGNAEVRFRRRNAANNADIWAQRFELSAAGSTVPTADTGSLQTIGPIRLKIAAGERVVVDVATNTPAGMILNANIWTQGPF